MIHYFHSFILQSFFFHSGLLRDMHTMTHYAALQIERVSMVLFLQQVSFLTMFLIYGQKKHIFVQAGFSGCNYLKSNKSFYRRKGCQEIICLNAVTQRQVAIYGAAELHSIEYFSSGKNGKGDQSAFDTTNKKYGTLGCSIVVAGNILGTDQINRRVVGVQVSALRDIEDSEILSLDSDTKLYTDSVAFIPSSISDFDAIATYVSALVSVHCVLPTVRQVGGSNDDFICCNNVVVVGGSDYAIFAARGLATLGANVTMISTRAFNTDQLDKLSVRVLPPVVGSQQLGFASAVGSFDSILDTLYNERDPLDNLPSLSREESDDEDSAKDYSDSAQNMRSSSILTLLRTRHNCETYISSFTDSQRFVRDEGLFFGRAKAKEYEKKIINMVEDICNSRSSIQNLISYIVPPKDYASKTVKKLFESGVTYTFPEAQGKKNGMLIRGWSFRDFWEFASWPRDANGSVRYGFPVSEEIDSGNLSENLRDRQNENKQESGENPVVVQVRGVEGLHDTIIAPQKDCILFLSAPYCRTCKSLSPQYTRMARYFSASKFLFAKADTSGIIGKELAKIFQVTSVPAFVMFRKGRIYGSVIQTTKLSKLEKAVRLLESGNEWDIGVILDDEG